MKKLLQITDYCPTLNKTYSITVEYADARTLDNPNRYIKGLADCDHHAYFKCPNVNNCPLIARAPEEVLG